MKFALHTSTAISSVLKEPEHFYVDIYYPKIRNYHPIHD